MKRWLSEILSKTTVGEALLFVLALAISIIVATLVATLLVGLVGLVSVTIQTLF